MPRRLAAQSVRKGTCARGHAPVGFSLSLPKTLMLGKPLISYLLRRRTEELSQRDFAHHCANVSVAVWGARLRSRIRPGIGLSQTDSLSRVHPLPVLLLCHGDPRAR